MNQRNDQRHGAPGARQAQASALTRQPRGLRAGLHGVAGSRGPGLAAGALTLLLGLAACTQVPLGDPTTSESGMKSAGQSPLSGAEVRGVLNKPQRYRWTTAAGASGYTQIAPNGRVRTWWDSDAVNGQIRFTDSGYCTRYEGVRNNREDCYRLYRVTATQFRIFRADGTYSGLIDLER